MIAYQQPCSTNQSCQQNCHQNNNRNRSIVKQTKQDDCRQSSTHSHSMQTDLDEIVDNNTYGSRDEYAKIKKLQYYWLIGKIPAEIIHPPVKEHGNEEGNDSFFLCSEINIIYKL